MVPLIVYQTKKSLFRSDFRVEIFCFLSGVPKKVQIFSKKCCQILTLWGAITFERLVRFTKFFRQSIGNLLLNRSSQNHFFRISSSCRNVEKTGKNWKIEKKWVVPTLTENISG